MRSEPSSVRIEWRRLFVPSLLILFLPVLATFALDMWLGTLPYITIVAIIICFPTATIWVIRIALQEMDRVIAEVAPPEPEVESDEVKSDGAGEVIDPERMSEVTQREGEGVMASDSRAATSSMP